MPLKAKSAYDPILSGIGLLESGNVSENAKQAFINDVENLIKLGNEGGKNAAGFILFPPIGGPFIAGAGANLFWFSGNQNFKADNLRDRKKSEVWHQVFIETLYAQTLSFLDFAGNTPLFPIFDPSAPFGIELAFPFTPADLIKELKTTPPKFLAKLASAGIKLSLPKIPVPSVPSILPQAISYNVDGTIKSISISAAPPEPKLNALILGLVTLPIDALISLLVPPQTKLVYDLPNLPKTVGEAVFKPFEAVMAKAGFDGSFIPVEFLASIFIYLKNVIAALCVVIVGSILGTGNIALQTAITLGLLEK